MNKYSTYLYSIDGSEKLYSRRETEELTGRKRIDSRSKSGILKKKFVANGHSVEIKAIKVWDAYVDGVLRMQAAESLKTIARDLYFSEDTVAGASKKRTKRAKGITVKVRYQDITLPRNVVVG